MTMLEKAAAAAWPFLWDATDTATPAHDAARARMRAALQAIREPDRQAVTRGMVAMMTDDLQPTGDEVAAGFTAMIDAILAEDKA